MSYPSSSGAPLLPILQTNARAGAPLDAMTAQVPMDQSRLMQVDQPGQAVGGNPMAVTVQSQVAQVRSPDGDAMLTFAMQTLQQMRQVNDPN